MTIVAGEDEEFNEIMEDLAKRHERSIVFVNFLDYYIDKNTNTTTDFHKDTYSDSDVELFDKAYKVFCKLMNTLVDTYGWYDYVGEYYEAFVLSGSKASDKGQFYTPRAISDLLSKICGADITVTEDETAYDPTCGSARNLLDFQSKHHCKCLGEDVDESACKMAVVNFHSNKVCRGQVNWIDTLTRDYNGTSWVVFPGAIYTTNLEEIEEIQKITGFTEYLSYDLNGGTKVQQCMCYLSDDETESEKMLRNEKIGGLDAYL